MMLKSMDLSMLLLSFLFLCLPIFTNADNQKILVLGGNGFMGSDTVEILLRYGYEITIVNRGSWYWDAKDRIFSRVKSINCDRENGVKNCEEFMKYLEGDGTHFEAVIDFSAYHEKQVKDSAEVLQGKTKLYIFISTDSVYDVCKVKPDGPYKEVDAIRPDDEDERKNYAAYRYGDRKLTAEEELIEQRVNGGIPYVILRLPDVMGPRDGTHRWWMYQLWLKTNSELKDRPVTIPEFLVGYGISMVYSPDVAKVIANLVRSPEIQDEAFNLAWPDVMTLEDILEDMSAELDLDDTKVHIKILERDAEKANVFLYPSGRRGPIDVTKAIEMLQWQPTPWKDAVRETVGFYEEAMKDEKYRQQMDEAIQVVEHYVMKPDENKTIFYKALERVYDIDLSHFTLNHDEL